MVDFLKHHQTQIQDICKKFGVSRLEVFGSAARGDYKPGKSDIDFLVDFQSADWHGAADRWFGLQTELQAIFKTKVELVDLQTVHNRFFLRSIAADRQLLYAA